MRNTFIDFTDFIDIASMFFEDVAARLETQFSPRFASSDLFF